LGTHPRDVFDLFFAPGEVTEIRAFGLSGKNAQAWEGWARGGGVVHGYFDDAEAFAQAALSLDAAGAPGVYFVLNPVTPALLARAVNRLKAAGGAKSPATTDKDVLCLRWLYLDLDPKRPAEISASDEELRAAIDLRARIAKWLRQRFGIPGGIPGMSGNGAHLLLRLPDLEPTKEHQGLIKACLRALQAEFGTELVGVDQTVDNPSRICKLYGTVARKGDHTDDRPHRRSYLEPKLHEKAKTLSDIPTLTIDQIQALAALAPPETHDRAPGHGQASPPSPSRRGRGRKKDLGPVDVGAYLRFYGVAYSEKVDGDRILYRLEQCRFDPNHGRNEAAIVQDQSGKITYQCFHDSCRGRTWADARQSISGGDPLSQFQAGFVPGGSPEAGAAPPPSDNAGSAGIVGAPWLIPSTGGRTRFVPARMAQYVEQEHAPLIHEGQEEGNKFYRYRKDRGVWVYVPRSALRKYISLELADHCNTGRMRDVIEVVTARCYKPAEELKRDPMWLNLQNGMIHVITGERREHAPEFNSRIQLPVEFDEKAKCLLWEDTLAGIFADDLSKIQTLQEFFGYCLYPDILFPAALFQVGGGRNGKGTVEHVLCAMLGRDNVCHISLKRMEDRFGAVEIRDKLLNASSETETSALEVTRFKQIAAGDTIQAEVKYEQDVTFQPVAKHMISMNNLPRIREKTDAFFRRIIILEYKQKFEGGDDDKRLKPKLREELNGVFMWALKGLKAVVEKEEIYQPPSVEAAKERLKHRINPVLTFVEESCVLGEDCYVLPKDLYEAYKGWCDDSRIKQPMIKRNFYEAIEQDFKVFRVRPHDATKKQYKGIRLRNALDEED